MSGRAPSLSPKKERSTGRRSGPLERPNRKQRVKTEEEDIFIKAESEDEKHRIVKSEVVNVVAQELNAAVLKKEEPPEDDPKPEPSEEEMAAKKYLNLVGATENVPKGYNHIDSDGRIFNPTLEVQRYEYYDHHTEKEEFRVGRCKRDDAQGEHWCHFFREGYQNHGYRYLNSDGGTYYKNPDDSEYYFNRWERWFKPSPTLIASVSRPTKL